MIKNVKINTITSLVTKLNQKIIDIRVQHSLKRTKDNFPGSILTDFEFKKSKEMSDKLKIIISETQ